MDSYCSEWKTDLAKDIHDCLKCKEYSLLRVKGRSKLMYWRRYLVDWLALTCQKYRLHSNAQHLAVCLFDRFTDQFEVEVSDVQLLVLCCLLIASKFEEKEENIPKFKTLIQQLEWELDSKEYLQMEIRILSAFKWEISFPTAVHFREYYMQVALGACDTMSGRPLIKREDAMIYMEKNVNYFLEVSLQDHSFLIFKPSLITSSCIAAARICLRIFPTWTRELEERTRFSYQHLTPCIEILLRTYDEDRLVSQKASPPVNTPHCAWKAMEDSPSQSPRALTSPLGLDAVAYAPTLPQNQSLIDGILF